MATDSNTPPPWLGDLQAAVWLQTDSAYLYAHARRSVAEGAPAGFWVSAQTQESAATSAKLARQCLGIE